MVKSGDFVFVVCRSTFYKYHVLNLPFPLASSTNSEGCASAVKRVLGKIDGVSDVQTDVAAKKVVVQADPSVSPQLMLEKLQKVSGRKCFMRDS